MTGRNHGRGAKAKAPAVVNLRTISGERRFFLGLESKE